MKFAHFTIGLLALVSPVAAWSKEGQSSPPSAFDHRGLKLHAQFAKTEPPLD